MNVLKPDPPDVLELLRRFGGELKSEAGLARAGWPDHGQQALFAEERARLGQFSLATDKRGRLHREVRPVQRLERRELLAPELEEPLRLEQVLETVLTEIGSLHVDEVSRGLREQYLAAVPGCANASAAVHVEADVALVRDLRLACVHPDADADRPGREPALDLRGRGDGVRSASERGEERVPLGVHLHAPVLGERGAQDTAVRSECPRIVRHRARGAASSSPRCR